MSLFLNLRNSSGRTRPWDLLTSNRNEYQKHKKEFLGIKVRRVREADNLTAICEPIF
jgi:hypothetical protein